MTTTTVNPISTASAAPKHLAPTSQLNPSTILQTAFSFWSSKVLLTAVEFGVFTKLADRRLTGIELGEELGLHPRAIADFFDTLVAMKFLDRDGNGPTARSFSMRPARVTSAASSSCSTPGCSNFGTTYLRRYAPASRRTK